MMKDVLENEPAGALGQQRPIVEVLRLACPTVAQMASYTAMQFIGTWLLTRMGDTGDTAATAASNAGIFAFAIISLGMGVLFLVNTLASQTYGRGDHRNCGRWLWQGIWFAIAFSLPLVLLVAPLRIMFASFGHEAELVRMQTLYLLIVMSASGIKLVSTSFSQFLLAVNRPSAVLISAVIGVSANCAFAYTFILGKFGMPALGIAGAAWAQNVGVTVELLCLIWFASRPDIRRTFGLDQWRPRWAEFRTLLRLGIPSGLQIVAEVLAWAFFATAAVGLLGTKAMAANTYMFRYMAVSVMPAIGIGTAVTALVGRYIGRGRPDLAAQRAHIGFALAGGYMICCAMLFFFGRHVLIGFFTSDPEVLELGATLLLVAAIYQGFDAMYVVYVGGLRGAGDTLVPAIVTGVLCWSIMLGGGWLVARHLPSLGIAGPWMAASIYCIIMGIFMFARFSMGRWRNIHLEQAADKDTLDGFDRTEAAEVAPCGKAV
jgi:multidrug resistance protein, MATE family